MPPRSETPFLPFATWVWHLFQNLLVHIYAALLLPDGRKPGEENGPESPVVDPSEARMKQSTINKTRAWGTESKARYLESSALCRHVPPMANQLLCHAPQSHQDSGKAGGSLQRARNHGLPGPGTARLREASSWKTDSPAVPGPPPFPEVPQRVSSLITMLSASGRGCGG